jgi:hypothetical protein
MKKLNEEADNDCIDSLIIHMACGSRIKWYWEGRLCGFRKIQSIYSQTEYGKNTLVVGDQDDGENPWVLLI